jgi:hypothetical protein
MIGDSDTERSNPPAPNWEKRWECGKYGILKEALHIKTGKYYYTCKMIDKKVVTRREFIVRISYVLSVPC